MRIGELARRSDLSRDTIRFYERNGLIVSSPGQSPTNGYRDYGYRDYGEDNVERLSMIREARRAGFSVADLRLFMQQIEQAGPADFETDDYLREKIAEVEAKISRMKKFLGTLKAAQQALQGPH